MNGEDPSGASAQQTATGEQAANVTQTPSRCGRLARISGRDIGVLQDCPDDEIGASSMIGLGLIIGPTIHGMAMIAGLRLLNVPLPIALLIAGITATAFFAVDRSMIRASDIEQAEAAVRKIGAWRGPRMSGMSRRLWSASLRTATSLVSATVLATFLGLHFFDADTRTHISAKQETMDAPYIERARGLLGAERQSLKLAEAQAKARVDDLQFSASEAGKARQTGLSDVAKEIGSLKAELTSLRAQKETHSREAARQRNLERCELVGRAPDCEEASGIGFPGPRWKLAGERAGEAEALAASVTLEIAAVAKAIEQAEEVYKALAGTPSHDLELSIAEAEAQHLTTSLAVATFELESEARASQLIDQMPGRVVLNPDSLAERLNALRAISQDNKAVLIAMLGVDALAFVLEMMAIIISVSRVPSEYALLRGMKLAALIRRLVNAGDQADIDDADLRQRAAELRSRQPITSDDEIERMRREISVEEMRDELLRKRRANDMVEETLNRKLTREGD